MTQDATRFINVAIDRETNRILEGLADLYHERHPSEARPGKTGIIRVLAHKAARDGVAFDQLGPLTDDGDYDLLRPGRGEWQQR